MKKKAFICKDEENHPTDMCNNKMCETIHCANMFRKEKGKNITNCKKHD